jgi:hypothetical protein
MTKQHISFPSIGQFREIIKAVHSSAKYHEVPVPKIKFIGTTKGHGTHFCAVRPFNGKAEDIYFQSRERIISVLDDNAGSATWGTAHRAELNKMFDRIAEYNKSDTPNDLIQIYGEWAGNSIHKGVGLNKLPKSFFVFAVRVSETAESSEWFSPDEILHVFDRGIENMHCIYDFKTWEIEIDFNHPELAQNQLIEWTMEVEKDCPVARSLLGEECTDELIGEGIVWSVKHSQDLPFDCNSYKFKVKGDKHSSSKVKTLAAVDVEKVKSIEEFVDKTVTENRLSQGIDKMQEMGLEIEPKNIGAYIKWVSGDVFKEELDTLLESGLTTKDVGSKLSTKARNYFLSKI